MTIQDKIDELFRFKYSSNKGYVYVLSCDYKDISLIKVGRSTDWEQRLARHKSSNPLIQYITHYECDMQAEYYLHKKLSNYLYEGSTEWFVDDGTLVDKIDNWMKGYVNDTLAEKYERCKKTVLKDLDRRRVFVWKFKSIFDKGFVYVVSDSQKKAKDHIRKHLGLRVEYIDRKKVTECGDLNIKVSGTSVYFNNIPLPSFKKHDHKLTDKERKYWDKRNTMAIRINKASL